MRRIKYFVASILDRYIAPEDGGVDSIFMDQDYGMSAFFKSKPGKDIWSAEEI
jgi:hypothetical protein